MTAQARVAQLVEHDLAKVGVAGSNPVSRSKGRHAASLFLCMIYLGIGASLGNRQQSMSQAIKYLKEAGCQILAVSSLYETAPWGGAATQPFYNAALSITFHHSAPVLLDLLLSIEQRLGRERGTRWADRHIDLDLLEYRREVWAHPRLTLPHPEYTRRAFVLQPLSEIAAQFIPTGTSKTVQELLSESEDADIRVVSDSSWIKNRIQSTTRSSF